MATDPRTLNIRQNHTYRCTFDWLSNTTTPTAIPLAGYHVTFAVLGRSGKLPSLISVDSTTTPTQVEVEPGGVVGRVRVTLTAVQTGTLKRSAVYALYASPPPETTIEEPVEYVASGPANLIKIGD